jgi:hypothetical protein
MRFATALMLWIAAAGTAVAQPAPPEQVTVTGTKDREVITRFVESLATPTRIAGKIARWDTGICPVVVGLRPEFTKFVSQRVKEVAVQVDAPVSQNPACKPNIQIVFTTAPQALADNLRKNQKGFLGYYDNEEQLAKLATVTRPIQAWYMTATRDARGKTEIDAATPTGMGLVIYLPCDRRPYICPMYLPNASAVSVTGSRLGDGLRSNFHHITIVADPQQLVDHEMGTISDYIAMLALSQISSLEVCQGLPSITNLIVPGCANTAPGLTDNDRGYLRGLYHMNAERDLRVQQSEVAYQMEKTLVGR